MGNLQRLSQISTVIARHGLGHYLAQRRRRRPAAAAGGGKARGGRGGGATPAQRFVALLEELGPTFIKFGQILSTRADLLPAPFVAALSSLQDHCAAMPWRQVEEAVHQGLGQPIAAAFARFEPQPVASASIAQVHRAWLQDGSEVAVKVQRPHMRRRILDDTDVLRLLARLCEAILEESGHLAPRRLVDQLEEALMRELDFRCEAANLGRFAQALSGAAQPRPYMVPAVFASHSSQTVLTMSFIHGQRLAAVGPARNRQAIAENIVLSAYEQLFVDGLFHADPHPGNCFVLDDDRLALVDFGAVGTLTFAMREALVVLVVAIGTRDADAAARLLYRVGGGDERLSLHRLRDDLASLFEQMMRDAKTFAQVAPSELLREIFEIAARFRLRLPPEYALVARASVTVEGIVRQLDPDLQVLMRCKPLLRRLIEERFNLPTLSDLSVRNLLRARDLARDLPLSASQILMDLEAGRLRLQVDNPKWDLIARNLDSLGVVVFMGLIAGGLVQGSLAALGRYDWSLWGLPVVPVVGLWLASLMFGAAVGRHLLGPRLRKISVGRVLSRRRLRARRR